jgi:hypothetical protein
VAFEDFVSTGTVTVAMPPATFTAVSLKRYDFPLTLNSVGVVGAVPRTTRPEAARRAREIEIAVNARPSPLLPVE